MQESAQHLPSDDNPLDTFSHSWFMPHCCWRIPDLNELDHKSADELKALISKSVIGLRQTMDKNTSAINAFENCRGVLVSAHLDSIALKFGYANASQTDVINTKKDEAVENYKKQQGIIESINENLGQRASACIFLLINEERKKKGRNLLSIIRLLKSRENAMLQGLIKSDLLKFSVSMCNELKRPEYSKVITRIEPELKVFNEKVRAALEKVPGGLIDKKPTKQLIEKELEAFPASADPQIQLVQAFYVVTDIFGRINTAAATQLAELVLPIEAENNIMSITPSHKVSDNKSW